VLKVYKTNELDNPSDSSNEKGQEMYPVLPQQGYPSAPPSYNNLPNAAAMQPNFAAQQPAMTTVYVQQAQFGPDSQAMNCPQCKATIMTKVDYKATGKTHLIASLICLLGGGCCCCFIPYCVEWHTKRHIIHVSFQIFYFCYFAFNYLIKIVFTGPNCKAYLGAQVSS
jgi:LITAF-like zinc ribbon domain